jgi:SNF2 family DNA or RNA helicase
VKESGKFQYLDKMMDIMFENGHKILLFSQFKGTLDILSDYLHKKMVKFLRLDGDTENLKR